MLKFASGKILYIHVENKECCMSEIMSYTVEGRINTSSTTNELQKSKTLDDFLSYMDKHFNRMKTNKNGNAIKRLFLY